MAPGLSDVVGLITASDALRVAVRNGENISHLVESLSREYYSACKVRPPAIYTFPPACITPPDENQSDDGNLSLVYNYWQSPISIGMTPDEEWPPHIRELGTIERPHRIPPVYLEVADHSIWASASVILSSHILTEIDRSSFLAELVGVLERVSCGGN